MRLRPYSPGGTCGAPVPPLFDFLHTRAIVRVAPIRYQDIRAEFSNDGIRGQWIRIREYCFRHCCKTEKYQVKVVKEDGTLLSMEDSIKHVAEQHQEHLKTVRSKSRRHMGAAAAAADGANILPAHKEDEGGEAQGARP